MSDLWNRCRRKHCDERKRLPGGFFFCRKLWRNGDPSGRKAGTDSLEGCYERCASTTGLVRRVKKVDGSLDNGKKIFAAKDRPEIKEQIDAWIDDICTGLVTLCCIFNPSRIILGGGIMAQEYVLSEVNRKVKAQIAPGLGIVEIVPAKLANTAGMMGAVSLAEKLLA